MEDQSKKVEPTKSELEILQILWDKGPSTVRVVNDELLKTKDVNYTTTLKLMQIMADKSILKRDQSQMKHIYHVVESEHKTKDQLLDKFIDSVYRGSAGKLVMQLLGNQKASKEDLDTIRQMLKEMDQK
ncbi:MAG: BlaI/MecI/CopY family transcriptional regulator [Bacteroidota bacterium]